jgi:hypothetical protein
VLREVPREADQLPDQLDELPALRAGGVDAGLAAAARQIEFFVETLVPPYLFPVRRTADQAGARCPPAR